MEGLKAKLVPLPKYMERLGGGDDNELASCGVVGEVLVCAVVPPDLPQPLHAGLLDVARHLKRALEAPDLLLHPHLQASFSLPSSSPSLSTSSSRDHISAFYLRLETGGAIDEAATALARPLLPPSRDELVEGEPEGYTLRVVAPVPAQGQPGRVEVTGRTCRGAFYGAQTLVQLLRAFNWGGSPRPLRLPLVSIADQPDFAARGVMLDVSRDKVPTVETVKRLVDELASLKVNQLQLYIEHTFAYPGHQQVWRDASPFTAEDILELDAYCRERFVELVPNQNSFGHFHRWLKHPAYRKYAEVPEGNLHPFLAVGDENEKEPFGLAPDDQSIALLDEIYAALLPNFSSRQFNVGCDETFDLGQGRSKQLCEEKGVQTVYIDFLNRVNELVSKKYRKKMQYWGDIVLQQPDLIHTLPKDAIALIWGYEASHPFAEQCKAFAALKEIPFYVCPGTSSWNTVVGRTDNAVANLVSAAHHGRENGAVGYLITDWGDNGHWQTLPVSYLGFMAGAGLAWNAEANDVRSYLSREHLASRLNMHVFHDTADLLGGVVYDLGCLYTVTGGEPQCNDSCIFKLELMADRLRFLQNPSEDNRRGVTVTSAEAAHERIVAALAALRKAHAGRDDAQLVIDEVAHGAAMADVSCRAMALSLRAPAQTTTAEEWPELQEAWTACKRQHEAIWLRRNRPGGLVDSLKRFTPLARFLAANSAQS